MGGTVMQVCLQPYPTKLDSFVPVQDLLPLPGPWTRLKFKALNVKFEHVT